MTAGNSSADAGFELARQCTPVRDPGGIDFGLNRLGGQRKGQPLIGQRAGGKGRDSSRQRRQRAWRRCCGSAQGGDLLCGHGRDQGRDKIGLGGKITIDGAGRDAGARGDRRDLHRGHATFRCERPGCGQDRVLAGGEFADDVVSSTVGHERSEHDSPAPCNNESAFSGASPARSCG